MLFNLKRKWFSLWVCTSLIVLIECKETEILNDGTLIDPKCLYHRILDTTSRSISGTPPPSSIPSDLEWAYTRCNSISMNHSMYIDDSRNGKGTHFKYLSDEITSLISSGKQLIENVPDTLLHRFTSNEAMTFLIQALRTIKQDLLNANVLVYGSTTPRIETLLLAAGCAHVTTVEYNQLTYEHDKITTLTVDEMNMMQKNKTLPFFDVALSISSFDHDGLGRYGDPLSPDADLIATDQVLRVVRPKGIFILTVPIGPDALVWNLHRRYGLIRLPLLLSAWNISQTIGYSETRAIQSASVFRPYEPVFILRKSDLFTNEVDHETTPVQWSIQNDELLLERSLQHRKQLFPSTYNGL